MCGIAGIHFKRAVDPGVLDRAAAHFGRSLHHRGPDHFGLHRTSRAVYANLRLAIVDRAGGDQPIYAPDGRRGIVYNGEVYNHAELRAPLERHHPFRTHTDTEVVLASWLAEGVAAFERYNGMFAACLWDESAGDDPERHAFTLVRDRLGAKPLYIYEDEHCIAFASELRTLLGLEGLDHSLNPVGFQDYLAYRYNLAPHTQFRRIEKLPAGCWFRWRDGRREIHRYAAISIVEPTEARPVGEYMEELDQILSRAVSSQLMGEVPIGVLLSGGLDSSTIAAYVHQAGARLKAYSIGFPEVNEFAYSQAVARKFDLDYTELTLTQDELRQGMDRVIAQLDEPIADTACFALSRLCETIRQDVTVVLSGEGGDEMFAGYGQHTLALEPGMDRDTVFGHFFLRSANDIQANQLLRDKAMPLHHLRHRAAYDQADTPLNGMQAFELSTWMPENLMMKADKVLMAHSLEGRFPFLDLDLYQFARRLPQAMKLPEPGSSKHVLRQLMSSRLPASVIDRPKMGFTVPPSFFLNGLHARLRDAIEQLRQQSVAEVLDLGALAGLLDAYYAGQPMPVFKVWNVAVLLLWWADIYPTLRARPRPLPLPAAGPRQKLVVYTVLVGAKESLNDPLEGLPANAGTDLDIDWVCLTDHRGLRSPTWRFEFIDDRHLPPEKLSRRPKALPHDYFPAAEYSLYVDNTVTFKRLPQAGDLVHAPGQHLFRAFRHATRHDPEEEATAVACLGYDDVDVICAQMDFIASRRPLTTVTPLTTATVLLRSHQHAAVRRFGRLWWESILAFSKRDQLSIDFARLEAGCSIDHWPGSSDDNPFVHWHGSLSRHRVQASFDAKRYAWQHRDDPAAQRDPRGHYLAHGSTTLGGAPDSRYQRTLPVLEYACYKQGSSLGHQVSPRRDMAGALEALLTPLLRDGLRFLIVRVQDTVSPQAFDARELDSATQALRLFMAKGVGTVLDLGADDLLPDGKIYTSDQQPYELVLLLGLPGNRLEAATQKLIRLLSPERGAWVAALSSPVQVTEAARTEQLIETTLGVRATLTLQASRHDEQTLPLHNTVAGCRWTPVPSPAKTPAAPPPTNRSTLEAAR